MTFERAWIPPSEVQAGERKRILNEAPRRGAAVFLRSGYAESQFATVRVKNI
jgi:hypothetical protein